MFMEERHAAILEIIAEKGSITTSEIQDRFGISYDSAKRDLRLLEEAGKLRRTHGGAIPLGDLTAFSSRKSEPSAFSDDECARIARYAASLIKEGELVFLPCERMGELVAQSLPRTLPLRVVTGSITIAQMLRRREGVSVILTGGEVGANGCCCDSFSADMLKRFRFDKVFLSTAAVSADFGVSVDDMRALAYYAAAVEGARKVIGLFPAERVGAEASVSVCRISQLDAILTGGSVSDDVRRAFDECGVSVIECE